MKDTNKEPVPATLAFRISPRLAEKLLREAKAADMRLSDYCRRKLDQKPLRTPTRSR